MTGRKKLNHNIRVEVEVGRVLMKSSALCEKKMMSTFNRPAAGRSVGLLEDIVVHSSRDSSHALRIVC
jgi:hypothetical protein